MLRHVWIVFTKELLDILRDRRTLVFMMVVPTIAMPALMWLTTDLMSSFAAKLAREQVSVLALNPEIAPALLAQIKQRSNSSGVAARMEAVLREVGISEQDLSLVGKDPQAFGRLLRSRKIDPEALSARLRQAAADSDFDLSSAALVERAFPPNFAIVTGLDPALGDPHDPARREAVLAEAVRRDQIAAAFEFAPDSEARLQAGETAEIKIYYLESSDRSTLALSGLKNILTATGRQLVAKRLEDRQLPGGFATPLRIRSSQLPGPGMLVKLLSQLLPYMILLFSFLGALYPAIDLGAGEKERGTLETLLVAPVSRLALVLGKFLVVLLAALVSAVLATVSLAISLQLGVFSTLALISGSTFSFSLTEAGMALLLVVPIGCIFASLLLAISIFAKSFKEAQSYASPLNMVIILPAFFSLLPGVKLDYATASIPIVNVSLALKEIFTGNLDQHWGHLGVIFLSSSAIAALLLWASARWFQREQVLFRS